MILFRYLTKEILVSMVAVSGTLLVIVMSGRFVKYLGQAATGDLAPEVVFSILLYRMPGFLELVLPLGLFIAILLTYGRFYVESEMTVMSACGLSPARLSLYTLAPSVLVAGLVAYLSLYAGPLGVSKVQVIFDDAKNSSGLDLLVSGRFRVEKNTGRVSYIKVLDNTRQEMREVFTAEQSTDNTGQKTLSVVLAESGSLQRSANNNSRYLVLENGFQYIGQPGTRQFRITEFEQYGQLIKDTEQKRRNYSKADAKTTTQLMESTSLADKATFHWRISLVILVPIIALIAQSLSKTDHRRGRYVKMLPAFLIYIVYLVALNAAREGIEKGSIPLNLGMWWIHGLFLLLAGLMLFGANGWLRLRVALRRPAEL